LRSTDHTLLVTPHPNMNESSPWRMQTKFITVLKQWTLQSCTCITVSVEWLFMFKYQRHPEWCDLYKSTPGHSPKPKRNTSSIALFVKWSRAWFINKHCVWKFTPWCSPFILSATGLWSTQHKLFDKLFRGPLSLWQFSPQMSWISWLSACRCGTLWFKWNSSFWPNWYHLTRRKLML